VPAYAVIGQKRVVSETKQLPAKRAWPDTSQKAEEDMESSISNSDGTSDVARRVEEYEWDDQMVEYEDSDSSHTLIQEPARIDNVPQELPDEVPVTGASSRVAMTLLDRMLQDCWLNWEEDLRRAYRNCNTEQGILEHWGLAGEGTGYVQGRRLTAE